MNPRHACWLSGAVGLSFALLSPAMAQDMSSDVLSGLSFREIGPVNMSGRIVDLAVVESNPFTFYVASSTGGVWKTTDNGVTLRPVFSNAGTHSVGAIAVHQTDTNIVWVGTGERASRQSSSWGDGVYRSTDGGDTWAHMGLRDSHHIGRIAIHPDNPDVVFVAAMGHLWGPNDERGLYRTDDAGATWTRVLEGDEDTGVVDVTYDPSDPNIMYAAKYQRRRRPYGFHGGGPGSGLFKSTDGGFTWRQLADGLPEGEVGRIGISVYRADPRIVYVSVEQGYRYNASTAYTERRAGVYRSEDKGESWQFMSDWNPRPMYASQILVDPNDDQRIYMLNAYSFSDDGGKTFDAPRNSTHGDDRLVWVNPADSRHVMKADDGGLAISYDRGLRWLYITHLPVSQWYRVSYDMRTPYWVYGGLQDNGSWAGPNATYRSEGILADDWIKTGGGDGFVNYVDTTDNRTLYTESQYLGLSRLDLVTRQRKWLRPGDPHGAIGARRNWDAWGPGIPEPELGNAMAPANWDGPFIISPHDTRTLYAGTNILWRSRDQGDNWESLGDLTTGVNRRELLIMGQRPHDSTLSLDDGIPYYPTISAVAESPLQEGLLYAGTDDGNLQMSRDGRAWVNISARLPGLPPSAWISGIEPSRHAEGTVYVAVNNYRNDDFANYLYRSDDFGRTWRSIVDGLPPNRVVRTVREDLRNADVLYLGTELGLFYSNSGGADWTEIRNNLPTLAANDIALHPRDNDLILGTHGRGVWILDNLTALQELTPETLASPAQLFTVQPATMIRYAGDKGHTGDMIFRGENPPAGAVIDFFLQEAQDSSAVMLTVHDASDREISRVRVGQPAAGINRAVWNLRYETARMSLGGDRRAQLAGPWVLPGQYTVRLAVNGAVQDQQVIVADDPRIEIADADREAWHEVLMTLHHVIRDQTAQLAALNDAKGGLNLSAARANEIDELLPLVTEVRSRLNQLYNRIGGWPGRPTGDQVSQMTYLQEWIGRLVPRVEAVVR